MTKCFNHLIQLSFPHLYRFALTILYSLFIFDNLHFVEAKDGNVCISWHKMHLFHNIVTTLTAPHTSITPDRYCTPPHTLDLFSSHRSRENACVRAYDRLFDRLSPLIDVALLHAFLPTLEFHTGHTLAGPWPPAAISTQQMTHTALHH